jgi:hypothetical protein
MKNGTIVETIRADTLFKKNDKVNFIFDGVSSIWADKIVVSRIKPKKFKKIKERNV